MAWMPMNSVATAESSTAASTRARLCSPTALRPIEPGDGADHDRAAGGQHQRDVEERQSHGANRLGGRRLHHADDERQQAPRDGIVDGGAGQRERAHRRLLQSAIAEDARQHREGGDRHRHAEEQQEGGERHAGAAPAMSNSTSASALPSAKGTTMLACEIDDRHREARAQHAEVELEADQEHVEDDADLRDDAEKRRRIGRAAGTPPPRARARPSSDGPSRMPPTTSPITAG